MVAAVDIEVLRKDLINKHDEAIKEYADNSSYYESERRPDAIGMAAPPEMQRLFPHIGYPRLYINSLAERIKLEGFKLPKQSEVDSALWSWWSANRLDTEFTLGCVEALVHGRAYITIGAPPTTVVSAENATIEDEIGAPPLIPIIRVESPLALYADVDPWTRKVTQAIRVYTDSDGEANRVVIYLPDRTVYQVKEESDWKTVSTVTHGLGIVPVVPLMNRTKLSDQLGASEITPELRSATDSAGRLLNNMQAAAELMAVPQRVLFGVKPEDLIGKDGAFTSTFDAYMAQIMTVSDPNGKIQQFQAAQLENFATGIREIRNEVIGITGLPPSYLANEQDNPSSADAIRSAERRLVMLAERKCQVFGGDLEEAMRVAFRVANNGADLPEEYYRLEAVFRNPSTPTYEAKADAASKLFANGQGVIPKERARIDIGYTPEEREEMKAWDAEDEQHAADLMTMYAKAGAVDDPDAESTGENAGSAQSAPSRDSASSAPAGDPVR